MSQVQLSGDLREGTGEYNTPLQWVAPISEAVGGFELDPCASRDSDLATHNVRERGGLTIQWDDYATVWCNHPYARGEPPKWIGKAYESDGLVVTLSKADPSTDWFHNYHTRADLLCFPDERIRFIGENADADFPVVFAAFGDYPEELREAFESFGWTITPSAIGGSEET